MSHCYTVSELYQDHSKALKDFISKRVSNAEIASDLTHETYLKIVEYCNQGKKCDHPKAFLYRVAINVMMDYYRKATKKKDIEVEVQKEEVQNLLNLEVVQCMIPLIDQLPSGYREALQMADMEGVKHKDIAAKMGISLSAAKSRVLRARKMIKNKLANCCNIETDSYGNILSCLPK